MSKIKNIIRKPAIATVAAVLALCCVLPMTVMASDGLRAETRTAVSSLDQIADGYDASGSVMAYEIAIP